MPPAKLGYRKARFGFVQEANDLFFCKSLFLRLISCLWDWTLSLGATQ